MKFKNIFKKKEKIGVIYQRIIDNKLIKKEIFNSLVNNNYSIERFSYFIPLSNGKTIATNSIGLIDYFGFNIFNKVEEVQRKNKQKVKLYLVK